nr:MAG TPA: hypothetical protein [Caudoviricetes sp.]
MRDSFNDHDSRPLRESLIVNLFFLPCGKRT